MIAIELISYHSLFCLAKENNKQLNFTNDKH